MTAASPSLPAPIPELLKLLKADPETILTHGHNDLTLVRAPGRLDILGATSDYTGSLACALPLDAGTAVVMQRRDDRRLILKNYSPQGPEERPHEIVELSLDDFYGTAALLPEATLRQLFAGTRQWAGCIGGAYPILARHKNITRRTHGANVAFYSNVPPGGGAGATAALACAALSAMTAAYHLLLEPLETAVMAQNVQHHLLGLPCGVSTAAAVTFGKADQLLLFSSQPHEIKGYLPVPEGFRFVGVHTAADAGGSIEAARRLRLSAAMAQAIISRTYRDLGMKKDPTGGYLANVSPEHYQKYFSPILPESIDGQTFLASYGPILDRAMAVDPAGRYAPRAAADYHIQENIRTQQFVEQVRICVAAKDTLARHVAATVAGGLMLQSHHAAAQHTGLRSANTDLLVEWIVQRGPDQGLYGARARGATLSVLAADTPLARAALQEICDACEKRSGTPARPLQGSSSGTAEAGPVRMLLSEL